MMIDFNINYGLSTELFIDGQINPDLIIEEGCWYLCTDSAELFIGASVNGKLTLKRINEAEIHQIPVDNLALKSDVESVKQEVIQTVAPDVEAVKTKVETVLIPKVEEEIAPTVEELKTWVENKEFLQHIDLNGYATEQWVENKGYLTAHQDLSNYALKSELPSVAGLASEEYVNNKFDSIEIPDVDLTGYATEEWVENKKYLTEHQDLSAYAKKTDIPTNYLTSIPDEYVTEAELVNKGYITDVSNKADTEHKHSITDIEDYVAPDLSEYAKLSDIPDIEAKADATHTHSINDIIDYVEPEIPSLEDYATKQDVTDAISNIDFPEVPEVNLDNYYTKTETTDTIATAIAVKANDVLFTTNKFVNNTIGAFVVGENLNGLTIAELFAKLLGLSDEPSLPEEPTGAIARIMASQIPMYSINGYTLTESPYQLFTYDESTKDAPITTSGFYQITDNAGTIVEAGYQDVTIAKDDVYYMIALPSFVDYNTMVTLQVFDELNNKWVPYDKIPMISDIDEIRSVCSEDPQMFIDSVDLNEYTIWMSEETPTGKLLRYVINE